MSRDWTEQTERGSPVMVYLIRWIALNLGRAPARLLLYPITAYFLLFAPGPRRASYDYLRRVTGRPVHWWHVAKHIFFFAATILDRVFLLSGKQSELDIRLHNVELVTEKVESGVGCILLGSHLGSFEVLRALAVTQRRFPLRVLMQEDHNKTVTRFIHALNPDIADTVIQLGEPDALLKAYEYLQQGYIIGVLGDRVVDGRETTPCELFGGKARFPTGPILAVSALNAPVFLFFGLYQGGRCYDVYFEQLAQRVTVDRKRCGQDLRIWTQEYADRLAHYARISPYNWFNFYDFWEISS